MQKLHEYEDEKRLEDIINEIIDLKFKPINPKTKSARLRHEERQGG